ncbi:TPA: hypothetical protein LAQ47_004039 [Escherichia coli]|nr:hypothetical protein [Escherichia coli]HBJ1428722.1 hypothetical protein [Escherichia coli]
MITIKFDAGDFEAGLRNLARRLTKARRAIDGLTVSYGFYSDKHYSGMTVADLARILASGVSFADGQPRDFMQVAASNKDLQNYTMKILRQITKEALNGRTQFTGKLNALGLYAQTILYQTIHLGTFNYPYNSPVWSQVKGFNKAMIHTGDLIKSISYRVTKE